MSDEYYTPEQTWENVLPYLPNEPIVVCEPFFGQGHTYNFLQKQGYFVLGEKDLEFFSDDATTMLENCDCVITNPPFSIKYDVINRLVELDVPFMMVYPMGCINTVNFRKAFNNDTSNVSMIVPQGRIKFLKNGELVNMNFDSVYLCYKMLPEKLVFLATVPFDKM